MKPLFLQIDRQYVDFDSCRAASVNVTEGAHAAPRGAAERSQSVDLATPDSFDSFKVRSHVLMFFIRLCSRHPGVSLLSLLSHQYSVLIMNSGRRLLRRL